MLSFINNHPWLVPAGHRLAPHFGGLQLRPPPGKKSLKGHQVAIDRNNATGTALFVEYVDIYLVGGFYSPTNPTQANGGIGSSRLSARSQSQNRFGGSPQTHGLGSHLSRSSALPFLRQNGYAQRSLCVSSLQQGHVNPGCWLLHVRGICTPPG